MTEKGSDQSASKRDYFGTFLKTVRDTPTQSAPEPPPPPEPEPAPIPTAVPAGDLTFAILGTLRTGGPTSPSALQELTGIGFAQFGELMARLTRAELVEVAGLPGHEVVRLTDKGASLADLASA